MFVGGTAAVLLSPVRAFARASQTIPLVPDSVCPLASIIDDPLADPGVTLYWWTEMLTQPSLWSSASAQPYIVG